MRTKIYSVVVVLLPLGVGLLVTDLVLVAQSDRFHFGHFDGRRAREQCA